jgi:hypothetical protein
VVPVIPPSATYDAHRSRPETRKPQYAVDEPRGNAISGEPTCSGTRYVASPMKNGTRKRRTADSAWSV